MNESEQIDKDEALLKLKTDPIVNMTFASLEIVLK